MSVTKQDLEPVRHNLDLEEELDLHVRRWRLRAWFSVILLVVVILAALGLFGGGPLSHVTVEASGNTLEYERFARFGNEVRFEFRMAPNANVVAVPLEYFGAFKLDRIVPQPERQRVQDERILFEFDRLGGLTARFYLVPRKPGLIRTNIRIQDASLPVTQFVYP